MYNFPGFYDRATELEWYWVDCEASTEFAEQNWQGGLRPIDANGNLDCGVVNSTSGSFNHLECAMNRSYICEITRRGRFIVLERINVDKGWRLGLGLR